MGLQSVLKNLVREGDLTVKLPGGGELRLGDGSGPPLVARVTSAAWAARIAAKPGLGVGEAYMDGGLVLEQGHIDDFIDLIGANAKNKTKKRGPFRRWLRKTLREANDRVAARKNVAHHYDLSYDLYRRFLKARFEHPMEDDREGFESFLYDSPVQTVEITHRGPAGQLLAVCVSSLPHWHKRPQVRPNQPSLPGAHALPPSP